MILTAALLAGYIWTQDFTPSQRYRWEQVADMSTITRTKAEALTIQQDDGVCVIYSTMSLEDARDRYINPRDGLSILNHELRHCRGERHTLKETS